MKTQSFSKLVVQIMIWFFIWILFSFFISNAIEAPIRFIQQSVISFLGMAIIICVNMYGLLPELYFKKRVLLFILAGGLLVYLTQELILWEGSPWQYWLRPREIPSRGPMGARRERMKAVFKTMGYVTRLMPLLIAFLGNSLWIIAEYAKEKEKEVLAIAKEKLDSDIKFLKSQINPHFLFNALNNIYSLSVLKSDKTPESLLSLSQMLRYMLYESDTEKVSLRKEVEYIDHFVQLQLLKDSRGLNVEVDTADANPNVMIAPLLFIPFIENAFKHSYIEDLDKGFIKMKLHSIENKVVLHITNSIPQTIIRKDTTGGIGLKNVRNRLELLYPNAYELNVKEESNAYSVNLSIEI